MYVILEPLKLFVTVTTVVYGEIRHLSLTPSVDMVLPSASWHRIHRYGRCGLDWNLGYRCHCSAPACEFNGSRKCTHHTSKGV
jgi:hypothetical protein